MPAGEMTHPYFGPKADPVTYSSRAAADRSVSARLSKLVGFKRKPMPHIDAMDRPSVYIYNVSNIEHVWRCPGTALPRLVMQACPEGADYGPPTIINELITDEYLGSDSTEHDMYNGEEIAFAAIQEGPGLPTSISLRPRGVFLSKTNPPHPSEIAAAKKLLTTTCEKLLREADAFFAGGKMLELSEEHRWAAAQLGQVRDWNKAHVQMIACASCGNPVKATASIHGGRDGCDAVINWSRAVAEGHRSKQQWLEASSELQADQRHPDYHEKHKN